VEHDVLLRRAASVFAQEFFLKNFPVQPRRCFTIGLECERPFMARSDLRGLPVIERCGDHLAELRRVYDDTYPKEIVSFLAAGYEITTDASPSVAEVNILPHETLFGIASIGATAFTRLREIAEKENAVFAGYGALVSAKDDLMDVAQRWKRKGRYDALRKAIPGVGIITPTASFQMHRAIQRKNVFQAMEALNLTVGFQIMPLAHSPVVLGRDTGMDAARELVWDQFSGPRSPIGQRCGVPPRAFSDAEDYFVYMAKLTMIVRMVDDGVYETPGIPFIDVMALELGSNPSDAHILGFFQKNKNWKIHEGSVWWSWRPRWEYGTLEFRPACAQPNDTYLAAAAFANGLVEAHDLLQEFVSDLNLPREAWMAFRQAAVAHSVDARLNGRSAYPLLKQVIDIAEEGLRRRREGEEVFLRPIWERYEHGTNPARAARAAWEKGPEGFREYILSTAESSEPWWRER